MTKHLTVSILASLSALLSCFATVSLAHADIFQWAYINPADPGLGKQQSTTLAPGGAGVSAVPSAYLNNRDRTMAYLIDANLTGASARFTNLSNADLDHAILANADFSGDLVI